ncbi:replicative DNA helicase [Virgibacillus litoralis]|uniref:DNA 5'-3' helicase n=1 Tax=Virgibacillus litoralis TaxID=578221 RepID=A0ABS4HGL4_9BACI|nr:replicative DNA helicase [Virgibacillus litoralis]MBP1950046.1 replicative DNA helicase [Virgibacillus litoralis]
MDINLDAEQALLGCILKKGNLIKETTLDEKHFADASHKILFKTLRKIEQKSEPIDTVSIITTIGQDSIVRLGGKQYLSKLINSVSSFEPFKTYEKYIFESYKIRVARQITEAGVRDSESISHIIKDLSDLELENNDVDYDHKESLQKLYEKIDNQEIGLSGIDTGFRELNRFLDGFQKKDLIISAARPSVGKTAKALNHAIHHCAKGGVTALFSLEMGEESLNKRMISTIGNIDGHKMKNPKQFFNEQDWADFSDALGFLSNMNLNIYDKSGQTIPYIRSKVSKLRRKYPDEDILVIIDYLQLIRPAKRYESKNVEIGDYSRSLKGVAKDMNVPVILLSQLSRGVESRQDKRPMMSDIRDSGSIEQDADVIEFLYRDDYYNKIKTENIIEVIIAKQRNGSIGTIELAFIKEHNKFVDLDYRRDH